LEKTFVEEILGERMFKNREALLLRLSTKYLFDGKLRV